MNDALRYVKVKDPEPKKTSGQILHHEIVEGLSVMRRPAIVSFTGPALKVVDPQALGVLAHRLTDHFSLVMIAISEFGRFLFCATGGNIVGGTLFVGVIKFGHAKPESKPV